MLMFGLDGLRLPALTPAFNAGLLIKQTGV